jgi:phage shock protein A
MNDQDRSPGHGYQQLNEAMVKLRRLLADVATSRKRLELRLQYLERKASELPSQGQESDGDTSKAPDTAVDRNIRRLSRALQDREIAETRLVEAVQQVRADADSDRSLIDANFATQQAAQAEAVLRQVEMFIALAEKENPTDGI